MLSLHILAFSIAETCSPQAVSWVCQSIAFLPPNCARKYRFCRPHTAIWGLDRVQRHRFSTTTRVPPYVSKWLCGLLYSKRGWRARVTACSPTPQRLACSGQRGIPAANWPTFLWWKPRKSGAALCRTNCAHRSVALARVVLSLFLLLASSSVNGATSFLFFSFNGECLLLVLSL